MSAATPPSSDGPRWSTTNYSSNGDSASVRSRSGERLIVLGYITAVAMPLVGFVLAAVIVLRDKADSKHAAWIIALSIIASGVWILVLTSGALSVTSTDLT